MQTLSDLRKTKRRRIAISLTPLIDVVFILLIFFMLASSFQKNRSVELVPPQKGKSAPTTGDDVPLTVWVTGLDRYEIDGQVHRLDDMRPLLEAQRSRHILINTGPDASLQDMVSLLDLTAQLSLPKVSLLPFEEHAP